MAKKKTIDANVRQLANRGRRSVGLTLPMEIVKELKWRAGQKVVVKKVQGGVLVKDWRK